MKVEMFGKLEVEASQDVDSCSVIILNALKWGQQSFNNV